MPLPEQIDLISDLVVNDQVALDDEPLLLAVYYASEAALDAGCLFEVEHNLGYGLDAVRRKRPDLDVTSIGAIDRMLRGYKADILALSALAPKLPKPGLAYPRNTEYPFNDASLGDWTAPAARSTYTLEEVKKAQRLAWPLHQIAARFSSSLRRR